MNHKFPWIAVVFALVLSSVFISPGSLWLDEGHTAYRALFGNLGEWYKQLVEGGNSDSMMPGYMLIIWGWIKVTGVNEFALRVSNIPWLLISLLALTRFRNAWFCLLCSPFVLYYLSELRPYSMQIAGGSLMLSSFAKGGLSDRKSGWLFLAGGWILSASSLTGIIWAIGAGIFQLVLQPSRLFDKKFLLDCAFTSPAFLILVVHYLNPALRGQGPAPLGGDLLVSFGAAGYELIGLSGLGPGRNELREDPSSIGTFILTLAAGTLVFALPIAIGFWDWFKHTNRRIIIAAIAGVGAPMIVFIYLCLTRDFRFLGRHLAPVAPLIPLCVAGCFNTRGSWFSFRRGIAIAALALGMISALSLRFADRHQKDDYKSATSLAMSYLNQGRRVVWAADSYVASVYEIPGKYDRPTNWIAWSFYAADRTLKDTDIVFLSKPDIYDQRGLLQQQLADQKFTLRSTLQAFRIYEKTTVPIPSFFPEP